MPYKTSKVFSEQQTSSAIAFVKGGHFSKESALVEFALRISGPGVCRCERGAFQF